MWQLSDEQNRLAQQIREGTIAPDKLSLPVREALLRCFREETLFPPRPISEPLQEEREAVQKKCYNSAKVSPESLIERSMAGGIGFLDLYSYHELKLCEQGEEFARQHPDQKFVSVGVEFNEGGSQFWGRNIFCINYDAYLYLRRLPENSVGNVNIDFPAYGFRSIAGETSYIETTLAYFRELVRVLQPEGEVSLYVPIEDKTLLQKAMIEIGFQEARFPPRKFNAVDFLERRPQHLGKIERLVGKV